MNSCRRDSLRLAGARARNSHTALITALFLFGFAATSGLADIVPGTSSVDALDASRGMVIVASDAIVDPINISTTHGGFEDGHALMSNGGLNSISFIQFDTPSPVAITGVRLFAHNDGAENGFRRAMNHFRLYADTDGDGTFESLAADQEINIDYSQQPGNTAVGATNLDLPIMLNVTNGFPRAVTAQHWRLEVTQGTNVQPYEGSRLVELDGIEDPPPICVGRPGSFVNGANQVQAKIEGAGYEQQQGDSGIFSVTLDPASSNLVLFGGFDFSVYPLQGSAFRVEQVLPELEGRGAVTVTDFDGNRCQLPVLFRQLSGAPTHELVCSNSGIGLDITNPNDATGPVACSSDSPDADGNVNAAEPPLPAGYERVPLDDPFPARVQTVWSRVTGDTEMVYSKQGPYRQNLRLMFSKSLSNATNYPTFRDVTTNVAKLYPQTNEGSRVSGSLGWESERNVKVTVAAQAEVCNGLDDDGDGSIDEGLPVDQPDTIDFDNDNYFLCASDPTQADCNDQIASINPGRLESCNGLDDNCNGLVDEENAGGGESCDTGLYGICAAGQASCVNAQIECTQVNQPAPSDSVCNGADDDCNGEVDEDYAPVSTSCGVGVCAANGVTSCAEGQVSDSCTPGIPAESDNSCNGADDNCDGQVDEGYVPTPTACGVGACAAVGQLSCLEGSTFDTCAPGAPSDELCNNIDDDCDGVVDEDNPESGGSCPLPGTEELGTLQCLGGELLCKPDLTPICSGDPSKLEGISRVDGKAVDDRPGDTGIQTIELDPTSTNLVLTGGATYDPTVPLATFSVVRAIESEDGRGAVIATDAGGHRCTLPIDFREVVGVPSNELLCANEGIALRATNPSDGTGTSSCASDSPDAPEPPFPPGYEPAPDAIKCRTQTITSNIHGETEMVYKKDGDFNPKLRLLYSHFENGAFTPFRDITTSVTQVFDLGVDPSKLNGSGSWSKVKIQCAVFSEICNGIDDDGDGSIDEGLPVSQLDTVDFDSDGYYLCASNPSTLDCNDQLASTNPAASESCNGLDDNCNGVADESFNLGATCVTGLGQCQASGKSVCSADGSGTVCDAVPGTPSPEVCNGLDDDCDGVIDNGAGSGESCMVPGALGLCAVGEATCGQDGIECTQTYTSPQTPIVTLLPAPPSPVPFDPSTPLPFSSGFTDSDPDGGVGNIVRERVLLDGCTVYDGDRVGDADGLLSDELVPLDRGLFCAAYLACGTTRWTNPVLRVEANDCGNHTGFDQKVLTGTFTVNPDVCRRAQEPLRRPQALSNALRLTKVGGELRMGWTAATNATVYHVYRADNPRMERAQLMATTSLFTLFDMGATAQQPPRYYVVRGVNEGGVEGN